MSVGKTTILLVSNNLLLYDMEFPDDTVIRINMAWIDDLDALETTVSKISNRIFIDIPLGRMKPPNNQYSLYEIAPLLKKHPHIKYIAISNVEGGEVINKFRDALGPEINLVPKIETEAGVKNLKEIHLALNEDAVMMLDRDDLFNDVMTKNGDVQTFIDLVNEIVSFCELQDIRLLRTRGVIFSDDV